MAAAGVGLVAAGISPVFRSSATSSAGRLKPHRISVPTRISAVYTEREAETTASTVSENGKFHKNHKFETKPGLFDESELEPASLKDYFEQAKDLIRSDGGPPRWFSPLECGSRLKNSPLLLFLPGVDGVGLGLILQHRRLGKIFDIWCLHIPVKDRTTFTDLVKLVERTVKSENYRSPNRPIYIVGESLGGCLALAVAARNPDIDLVLILANPATSFSKSPLQPLIPLLEVVPQQLYLSQPYTLMLSLMAGDPLRMAFANMEERLPLQQVVGELSQGLVALSAYLSVLSDILPRETLLWKLQMLKSASASANSCLHAVKAQTLILSRWLTDATSPVMLSTLENGKIVRGLAGIPSEGPVLLVGYHMLLGFEVGPMLSQFLDERNILLRGLAHPMMFMKTDGSLPDPPTFDKFRIMGAVPVSGTNFYKLLSSKSHVLLYPGGLREASHRKGEQYKLFWPEQSEFVRMAAVFGAKILPFGAVGEDDFAEVFFDYDDQMKIPYFRDLIARQNEETVTLRRDVNGEVGNQDIHFTGLLPKLPGRFYYFFGKPIETKGRKHELRDREKCHELYLHVKSEVESCLAYLKFRAMWNEVHRRIVIPSRHNHPLMGSTLPYEYGIRFKHPNPLAKRKKLELPKT
ncbi:hypothetical protein L1049_002688 [Liquidambar formosana]|uniref:Serine aminopeptidase S33 domain-containing protein n=1 Tax=Liquidambar formosana TaxID=63359 RepID=A0AAP0NHW9_LIQFO